MQVTRHIHALKVPFNIPIRPGIYLPRFVYIYLIFSKDEVWLVDAGVAGSEKVILEYVQACGRKSEELKLIIQTHSHPDHIGATRAIKQATGSRVAAHAAEKAWIEDVHLQFRERPVPGFDMLVGGSVSVDQLLEDGEVLAMGREVSLVVVHTPGHSAGSLSLWCPEDKALICGDAVAVPGGVPIYEDAVQSVRSVERLKTMEAEVLLSSWDEPRAGEEVKAVLKESTRYLRQIQGLVRQAAGARSGVYDPLMLCKTVLNKLELPEVAATPLVARTFAAHLKNPPLVRRCRDEDFEAVYSIINEAALAYKGVIPEDRWNEPYMPREHLASEIQSGVQFWGYEELGELVGVMGIQDVSDVTLIRHAYVRTSEQGRGIGGELLIKLRSSTVRPVMVGTWIAASWAVSFYERHGFIAVSPEETRRLLKKYWSIPERQVETSVVLVEDAASAAHSKV